MNIVVVGTGYVGLVTGACFADIGHQVTCVDIDAQKIERLKQGIIPIFEPGLDHVVLSNVKAGRLEFTTSLASVLPNAEVAVIAVGTPSRDDGYADMQYVYAVADEIGRNINHYMVVVDKSTVPVGTGREVENIIKKYYSGEFAVVSCPEFLREGSAVSDFANPDRIVIGVSDDKSAQIMLDVFKPVKGEKVVTTLESAELIKYASNAFLATKISFINEIAQLCERSGADIEEVAYGLGLDNRIGGKFLHAGIGWGGSCFPKDVRALDHIAGSHGYDFRLLKSVIEVNNNQRVSFVDRIVSELNGVSGKRLAVLGLAFKGNTDDVRDSAAIDIIELLVEKGAQVAAFDYEGTENAKKSLEGVVVEYATDPYDAIKGADAVIIATEWMQFKSLDWKKVKELLAAPIIFDGRNLLQPKRMREEFGFTYHSIGRK